MIRKMNKLDKNYESTISGQLSASFGSQFI